MQILRVLPDGLHWFTCKIHGRKGQSVNIGAAAISARVEVLSSLPKQGAQGSATDIVNYCSLTVIGDWVYNPVTFSIFAIIQELDSRSSVIRSALGSL